jgi:hypothetical protein
MVAHAHDAPRSAVSPSRRRLRVVRRWAATKGGAWLSNPKHIGFTLIVALLLAFYIWIFFFLPSAEVLTAVSIQTERVSFEDVSEKAAFPVYGMRISVDSAGDPALAALDQQCVDGLFRPTRYAVVTYGRVGLGPLEIDVARGSVPSSDRDPVLGVFERRSNDRPLKMTTPVYFEWDKACAMAHVQAGGLATKNESFPPPLPVWGRLSIGGEFRPISRPGLPEPRLLIGGQIRVSARSIHVSDKLKSIDKPTLYPVASLDVPVGSRLVAAADDASGPRGLVTNWWGLTYVDSSKPALTLEAATNASKLQVYHANLSEPDVIEVATLTQLTNDPQIKRLHFWLAVLVSFFGASGWIAEKIYRSREKKGS